MHSLKSVPGQSVKRIKSGSFGNKAALRKKNYLNETKHFGMLNTYTDEKVSALFMSL